MLPPEQAPATGQWLSRAGLEPKTVRIGRLDVRYVRKGQGKTVILIHGLASSIYTWAEVIGPLSEKFDVVALDLPGFGASSKPGDLSFDEYEPTLIGLMKALGISKAHFVGNSLGGAASLLLALREPDRVDRLVIIDTPRLSMKPGERPLLAKVLASEIASVLADHLPVKRLAARFFLRELFRDETRLTDERIDEYVAPLMGAGASASVRSLLLKGSEEAIAADISTIRAETLVLWGRFDPWFPVSQADALVAELKNARKVVLETGHLPQEERPAEVARLIGDFLIP